MFKKLTAILLVFVMVFGLASTTAFASDVVAEGTCGENVAWVLTADNTLTISGTGPMTDYRLGTYAPWWSSYRTQIQSVVIRDGITSIGAYAFYGLKNLTSVTISNSISSIGKYAFSGCGKLPQVTIPDSVVTIGEHAFSGCSALPEITIPDSVTTIGDSAFQSCSGLTAIMIPDSVTSIGSLAFHGCTSLTDVTIGRGLTSLGHQAFYLCPVLKQVTIHGSNAVLDYMVFSGCPNLTDVTLGDGVESIGKGAFEECSSLVRLSLGSGIKTINEGAFYECVSLSTVTIPASVTTIGSCTFYGCTKLTEFYVEPGNTSYSNDASDVLFNEDKTTLVQIPCGMSGSYTIPDSVNSICEYAFATCDMLTEVTIGSGLRKIGDNAFYKSCGLTEVTIPDNITALGDRAFHWCTALEKVTLPESLTSIGDNAFSYCPALTRIHIPAGVTLIERGAFAACKNLEGIYVDADNPNYCSDEDGVLYSKDRTELLQFPGAMQGSYMICDSVKTINDYAFERNYGFRELTSVIIPDSVTSIRWCAFNRNYSLTDVYYAGTEAQWNAIEFGNANDELIEARIHYRSVPHKTLAELTEEDYLAFSALVYGNISSDAVGLTVHEFCNSFWDDAWDHAGNTWGSICIHIASWRIDRVWSEESGCFAVLFVNDIGEAVLAYRGSDSLSRDFDDYDGFSEWYANDFPAELGEAVGAQLGDALAICDDVSAQFGIDGFAVTGHSLGGSLGDTVSVYSGCKAVTFNALPILDAAFCRAPLLMSKGFNGMDRWNFLDHANQYDILSGTYEPLTASTKIKPYSAHSSRYSAAEYHQNHALEAMLIADEYGEPVMSQIVDLFEPAAAISHELSTGLADALDGYAAPGQSTVTTVVGRALDLGTSGSDTFHAGMQSLLSRTSFGGDGSDQITTGSMADTLAGGPGDDTLDGSYHNDTYIYQKGDGLDTIYDIAGSDSLWLHGFAEDDTIEVSESEGDDFIWITCNSERIAGISKNNRTYWLSLLNSNHFKIYVDRGSGTPTEFDITDYFNIFRFGSRILIGCPVHVEVLDADGNVVHTLTDGEVGSWYTDYGNFYVFEEENGEYGKILDLVEGYSARIVGAGDGTMDVTYQVPVDGALSAPVSVSAVPVTDSLVAAVEESADGEVHLVIDEDGDGTTDRACRLHVENPFNDVPADSFYYEPVMWAVENSITNGISTTEFGSTYPCNRAQVVTFLWRAAGSPEPNVTENPFVDVEKGSFYEKAVLWAVEKGITTGTDNTQFSPNMSCNRATVVTFLYRAFESPAIESEGNPFTDVPTDSWYTTPVLWAVERGITNGLSADSFGPDAICNRAQIVTFLYRAYID